MSEALKELFDAYKHLPVGVMFFKDRKLFFVNDHLRNVLLLQNLGSIEMIQIIGEMVGLENFSDESLCDFFLQNNLFLYRDKHFQIDRQSYDTISVFVIVRVSDESISTIDKTRSLRELRQDKMAVAHQHLSEDGYHPLLNQALGDWTNSHYPSIVLYKGIPIKAESSITDNSDGEIAVRVEKNSCLLHRLG